MVCCVDELLEPVLSVAGVLEFHKQQIGSARAPKHHHTVAAQGVVFCGDAAIKGDRLNGLSPQWKQVCLDVIFLEAIGSPAQGVGRAVVHANTMGMG
jgi:hypothetical protein